MQATLNQSPLFQELVAELGHDPLDHDDKSWDEYNLAAHYHDVQMKEFDELIAE